MNSTIQINKTDLIIRPSSLNTYLGCSYQWARVFIGGQSTIPNSRAVIGTGIHGGAESLWKEAILTSDIATVNLAAAKDAAVHTFNEAVEAQGISYADDEDDNSATSEIIAGIDAFYEDIMPYASIPKFVEHRFTQKVEEHPLVKAVSGTVDYYAAEKVLADIKTSKRASTPANHVIQQSIYKMLAEHEGYKVDTAHIHNVILTKNPTGAILPLEPNVAQAKFVLNSLLDVTELLVNDQVQPEILFRGNPGYMFCSKKYCTLHSTCPFVKGNAPEVTSNAKATIAKETKKVRENKAVKL